MPSALKTQVAASISPLAGKPARPEMLIDPARLEREYFECRPDPRDSAQMVRFGTSGHRGTSLRGSFNEAHILAIAEDLGLITPDVIQLRDSQHLLGMRVLQFAFDGDPKNPHLPHNYGHNTVAYTGTHDNNTTRAWFESLPETQRQAVWAYLRRAPGDTREAAPELMQLAWSSSAALAIAPLQDLLNLGISARMNTPGQASGNWRWRITDAALSPAAFDWLRALTLETGRHPADFPAMESAALQKAEMTV